MRPHRRAWLALVLVFLALPPAPALPGGAGGEHAADPARGLVLAAVRDVDVDPVGVALRFAGVPASDRAADAWVPREAPPTLLHALARVHAAAGEPPLDARESAALRAAAARVPPSWAGGAALVLDAMADALTEDGATPEGLAAAARVVRAVEGTRYAFLGARPEPEFVFEDPRGYVRLDSRANDTVHERVFALNVDARGNDTYVGAHAGAALGARSVMIVLDLAGDDVYDAGDPGTQFSAQGASVNGVLGLLWDEAGDDEYTAHAVEAGRAVAYQGACWGSGLGMLVDRAGGDRYAANGTEQGGLQGAATGCPGILLDLDGNDRYEAGDGTAVAAQGATGLAGQGLLLDRWGDDRYEATTEQNQGQGAFLGVGFLVDLHGDDTYNGESGNNLVRPDVSVGHQTGAGARVDHALPRASESVITFVYYAGSADEDEDGHNVLHFRRRDARVSPSGAIEFENDAPYRPLGVSILGDPDDRERLEPMDLSGGERCVIALVDSGINPYHNAFLASAFDARDRIPGFPASAVALDLSLDARGYEDALAQDAGTWDAVTEGVLYTIPGTRIAGVISLGPAGGNHAGDRRVLDDTGHGTGVAGAALALAPDCAIVAVEAGDVVEALQWVATQPWIDVVSMSINMRASMYLPDLVANATREVTRSGKAVFVASGNGLTGRDVPSPAVGVASPYSGPGWVVSVGSVAWWNNQSVWWGTYPVDAVSRGVDVRVPAWNSVDGQVAFDGSSAATPRVAGATAHVLGAARAAVAAGNGTLPGSGPIADGVLTRGELEFTVLRAARPVDVATSFMECVNPSVNDCVLARRWPVYMLPGTPGSEFVTQGYGVVDAGTRDAAVRVVTGEAPAADRTTADSWWQVLHMERESWWAAHDDHGVYVDV